MSRIYQSVTSYLPFGRKSQPPPAPEQPQNEKQEEKNADTEAKNLENGKHLADGENKTNGSPLGEGEGDPETVADKKGAEVKDDTEELPSNKKTDEVYDPKTQPGYLRWAAGGLVGAASSTVGYGIGGVKWVANTGYNTTSAVVTTTTGVIKKVPQVIKRKDKKE